MSVTNKREWFEKNNPGVGFRFESDKLHRIITNILRVPPDGGGEMKSIDDVASLPLPHSSTGTIDRATVWDDGLLERATADRRLFESLLISGGDERIAIDLATARNR